VKSCIGRSSKNQGTSKAHHGTFDEDDVRRMREAARWDDRDPFHVIPMVYKSVFLSASIFLVVAVLTCCASKIYANLYCGREFAEQGADGQAAENEWNQLLVEYQKKYKDEASEFKLLLDGSVPKNWEEILPVMANLFPLFPVLFLLLFFVAKIC
jgi:transketolase